MAQPSSAPSSNTSATATPILALDDVSYAYAKGGPDVISHISHDFAAGQVTSIVGPSGAGKTTLLSLISGLTTPTGGAVLFEGRDLASIDRYWYRSRDIGVIFQSYNLLPGLTVLENIMLTMDASGKRFDRLKREIALDLLKQAGIPDGAKILIHDSVRPFVEQQSIDGCIDSLDQFNAATVAYASTDTILLTEDLGERKVVCSVPDRTNAFRAQTPQAFRFGTITKAYELATADPDFHPTDDTRVVVDYLPNEPVAIVAGSETNLKITTQADMPIAENIARSLDPEHAKQEAKARMHAVFAEAFSQMHKH